MATNLRTAQINTLRGLLRELGVAIPVGAEKVLPQVRTLIQDADSGIPDALRPVLATACDEIEALGRNIKMTERQLEALAEQTPAVQRLESAPGIGLITATALPAFIGNIQRFPSGRHFAELHRAHPQGVLERYAAASGADLEARGRLHPDALHPRRALHPLPRQEGQAARPAADLGLALEKRIGHNKAAVALANKLARIAWAVWKHDKDYVSAVEQAA